MAEAPERILLSDDELAELAAWDHAVGETEYIRADLAGWRPIETAPKDGKPLMLWREGDPTGEWPFMGDWDEGVWRMYIDGQLIEPTHWQHVPGPPQE